jgi:hypothetical protein
VLRGLIPVCQVTARHHELGLGLGYERAQVAFHLRLLSRAGVQIRHVQDT